MTTPISEPHCPLTPWCRLRNWVVAAGLVSVLATAWSVGSALTATPGAGFDAQAALNEAAAMGQDLSQANGWPLVERLVEFSELLDADAKAWALAEINAGRLEGDEGDVERARLDFKLFLSDAGGYPDEVELAIAHRGRELAIERGVEQLLDEVAAAPRYARVYDFDGIALDVELPELWYARSVTGLAVREFRVAMDLGDRSRAERALGWVGGLSRACAGDGITLAGRVALGLHDMVGDEALALMWASAGDERALRLLLDVLPERLPDTLDERAWAGDDVILRDLVERHFASRWRGGSMLLSEMHDGEWWSDMPGWAPDLPGRWEDPLGALMPGRADAERALREVTRRSAAYLGASAIERRALWEADSVWRDSLPAPLGDIGHWLRSRWSALHSRDRRQARRSCIRLMIALEVYRAEHGAYPVALGELTPSLLAELPLDPFAESGTFRYTLLDKADEQGRGYWLHNDAAVTVKRGRWRDDPERFSGATAMNPPPPSP